MALTLVAWMFSGFLVFSCVSLAYSAWKQESWLSGRSRTALLVGALEAGSFAGILRLIAQWSTGTVVLWMVAVAALAAAVAGLIIRWHELPVQSRSAGNAAPEPDAPAGPAPGAAAREVPGGTATATALRKKPKKKPKKEPGRAAAAGHSCFFAAVVALNLVAG